MRNIAAFNEVLRLDPSHPGAGNDLGYVMTEQGRSLTEAESLIRGEPNRTQIALTALSDKVREMA